MKSKPTKKISGHESLDTLVQDREEWNYFYPTSGKISQTIKIPVGHKVFLVKKVLSILTLGKREVNRAGVRLHIFKSIYFLSHISWS